MILGRKDTSDVYQGMNSTKARIVEAAWNLSTTHKAVLNSVDYSSISTHPDDMRGIYMDNCFLLQTTLSFFMKSIKYCLVVQLGQMKKMGYLCNESHQKIS
jgi:hypothetical protein